MLPVIFGTGRQDIVTVKGTGLEAQLLVLNPILALNDLHCVAHPHRAWAFSFMNGGNNSTGSMDAEN